jgi:hypothetical protein
MIWLDPNCTWIIIGWFLTNFYFFCGSAIWDGSQSMFNKKINNLLQSSLKVLSQLNHTGPNMTRHARNIPLMVLGQHSVWEPFFSSIKILQGSIESCYFLLNKISIYNYGHLLRYTSRFVNQRLLSP